MYFTGFSVTCKKMATWNFEPPTSGEKGWGEKVKAWAEAGLKPG